MRALFSRFNNANKTQRDAKRVAALSLIACDIDGTLLNEEGDVFESTMHLVQEIVANGIHFCLVSGRSYQAAKDVHDILGLDGPIAAMDGAIVVNSNGSVIRQHCIASEVASELARARQDNAFVTTALSPTTMYFESRAYLPEYLRHDAISSKAIQSLEQCGPDILRYYVVGEFVILERLRRMLAETRASELELTLRHSRRQSSQSVLEIRPASADKGSAVRELQELLSVTGDRVAVIGDYENDLPMFIDEYYCVSFPNAVSSLKKKAHFICRDNASHGGLDEFFRFVLSQRPSNHA